MAQWSIDRSNMENMRITKDSAGGALKVMIEEGLESPRRRYSYSPAPQGHFPEELATTAPTGLMSWDDVRVRYEYYKSRGYLRDLDLKVCWHIDWCLFATWMRFIRIESVNICFYSTQSIIGLCKMGGVVVSIPRVVEARTLLWVLWATAAKPKASAQEGSHHATVELKSQYGAHT